MLHNKWCHRKHIYVRFFFATLNLAKQTPFKSIRADTGMNLSVRLFIVAHRLTRIICKEMWVREQKPRER